MNKTKLIDAVAKATDQPKILVKEILEAGFDETAGALRRGEDVKIPGFGNYSVSLRPARAARNPRTGEAVHVAESKVVKFKAADAVNSSLNRR